MQESLFVWARWNPYLAGDWKLRNLTACAGWERLTASEQHYYIESGVYTLPPAKMG
jgi:hypothetical protein